MASTPLMVLAGNAVITWDSLNEPDDPFTFYPHGALPIADVAWNHNGQGRKHYQVAILYSNFFCFHF